MASKAGIYVGTAAFGGAVMLWLAHYGNRAQSPPTAPASPTPTVTVTAVASPASVAHDAPMWPVMLGSIVVVVGMAVATWFAIRRIKVNHEGDMRVLLGAREVPPRREQPREQHYYDEPADQEQRSTYTPPPTAVIWSMIAMRRDTNTQHGQFYAQFREPVTLSTAKDRVTRWIGLDQRFTLKAVPFTGDPAGINIKVREN